MTTVRNENPSIPISFRSRDDKNEPEQTAQIVTSDDHVYQSKVLNKSPSPEFPRHNTTESAAQTEMLQPNYQSTAEA